MVLLSACLFMGRYWTLHAAFKRVWQILKTTYHANCVTYHGAQNVHITAIMQNLKSTSNVNSLAIAGIVVRLTKISTAMNTLLLRDKGSRAQWT